MQIIKGGVLFVVGAWALSGCASQWKIQGGPRECAQMCQSWNMELTGMVGVGNQDAVGPGATACVCQVRRAAADSKSNDVGAPGSSAGMSAAVVAIEEAQRQQSQQAPNH